MLVICALALIVASAVFLVTGLAGGDVGDLYVSMALCVGSLVVLAVASRVSRVRPADPMPAEPTPADPVAEEPADDPASIWSPAPDPAPAAEVEPTPVPEVEVATNGSAPFPIADYDHLSVTQILPLVPELWPEEVPRVAGRERATQARPAVLDALAERIGDPSLAFPIAAYETLDTEQVTGLLEDLDDADLATVQAAERAGAARVGVLVAVANRIASRHETYATVTH